MGLLDDAIREHLELKRRRGADATEISRQESDALGPVRRSPEGAPEISDDAPAGLAGTEPPGASPWEDETTVHAAPPAAEPPPFPAPAAAEPPPVSYEPPAVVPPLPAQPEPAFDPEPAHDPFPSYEPEPEPEPAAEAPADEPDEPAAPSLLSRFKPGGRMRYSRRDPKASDEPPAEPPPPAHEPPPAYASASPYAPPADEPDIVPADEEPDGDDILEETPDFLEETPEHDRLWFEQRPPRDFKFDD